MHCLQTVGAVDWEFFQFEDRYFLAVANSFDKVPNVDESLRNISSHIYELNVRFAKFVLYQEIETYG